MLCSVVAATDEEDDTSVSDDSEKEYNTDGTETELLYSEYNGDEMLLLCLARQVGDETAHKFTVHHF